MYSFVASLTDIFEKEEVKFLGVVSPEIAADFRRYETWIENQQHGSMHYLEKNSECRRDLNRVLENVKSVFSFALPYDHPITETEFKIARYAKFEDYHGLLRKKGERLVEALRTHYQDTSHSWRVTVDSAPILERALAKKTGEGFIGKNTCFIHPKYGSFLLLGEVLTSLTVSEVSKEVTESCGTCTLCQVECPTGALSKDYEIDARKCLAYWTIEHRGVIPFEYWPYLKEYVFGCDICQDVCPYNENARGTLPKSISLKKYPGLFETATLSEKDYQTYFGGTPLTRAKRDGLRRNALIAMTVSQHPRLAEAKERVDQDAAGFLKETLLQIPTYLKVTGNRTMVATTN